MNAFHMYWNPSEGARAFKDYDILTMVLSAVQWKAANSGRLTFYGDFKTVEMLEQMHLVGLWDRCDGQLLDKKIDREHYNVSVFYPIGKFIVLLEESCPCAMIDTDLIIWKNIDSFLQKKDVIFTHWEDTKSDTRWYCRKEKLPVPQGYSFHTMWNFSLRAANTSFMYFKDCSLRDYYVECAMKYMYNNPCTVNMSGKSALLFAEQRLFTICVDEKGNWQKTAPLIDITWDAKRGKFQVSKKRPEGWDFYQPDNNSIVTHTWIAKAQIEKNDKYRSYFSCRLIEKLRILDRHVEDILITIPCIQPYLELLDIYETTDAMLEKGIVTRELYPGSHEAD